MGARREVYEVPLNRFSVNAIRPPYAMNIVLPEFPILSQFRLIFLFSSIGLVLTCSLSCSTGSRSMVLRLAFMIFLKNVLHAISIDIVKCP